MAVLVFSRKVGNFREKHDTNFRLKARTNELFTQTRC